MIEFKKTFGADHSTELAEFTAKINEAKEKKAKIKIFTHVRKMLDRYRCIDCPQEPIVLTDWWQSGGLLYYRKGRFDYGAISFDEIDRLVAE